jgi:hypothetical protein
MKGNRIQEQHMSTIDEICSRFFRFRAGASDWRGYGALVVLV